MTDSSRLDEHNERPCERKKNCVYAMSVGSDGMVQREVVGMLIVMMESAETV
jgi:hypothetical protein